MHWDDQQIICDTIMGREQCQQSFAFKYFIFYIYDNYRHLLSQPGFACWYRNGFMRQSAAAVEAKMCAWGLPANFRLPFNIAYWLSLITIILNSKYLTFILVVVEG